jgi:hypothetical protein
MFNDTKLLSGKTLIAGTIDGYHLRSMLVTGILPELRKMGCRIICLYPYPDMSFLAGYKGLGIEFKKIDISRPSIPEWLLLASVNGIFRNITPGQNLIANRVNVSRKRKFVQVTAGTFLRSKRFLKVLERFIERYRNSADVKTFFNKTKLDLFLSGTPGWKYPELPYLREARKRKIPIICQILSWDNLTMSGPFFIKPDKLMLWNRHMKKLAIDHFEYKENDLYITGSPQFDAYRNFKKSKADAKKGLMDYLKIDKTRYKRIITFAGIPLCLAPFQGDALELLIEFISTVPDLNDVALVFRPHPQNKLDSYIHPSGIKGLYINNPHTYLDNRGINNTVRWQPDSDSLNELALVMKGSDVVITIASSITLDAAAVDTPVINFAFDISNKMPIGLLYESEHYKHVTYSGAVDIAKSPEDLLKKIRLALAEPSLKRKERLFLVEDICGKMNINAAVAQVEIIKNYLLNSENE